MKKINFRFSLCDDKCNLISLRIVYVIQLTYVVFIQQWQFKNRINRIAVRKSLFSFAGHRYILKLI